MRSARWQTVKTGKTAVHVQRVNQSSAISDLNAVNHALQALPVPTRQAIVNNVVSDIQSKADSLRQSQWFARFRSIVRSALLQKEEKSMKSSASTTLRDMAVVSQRVIDVVCLGLGSLYDHTRPNSIPPGCKNARVQLAALWLLIEDFSSSFENDTEDSIRKRKVRAVAYDPMFHVVDKEILTKLGIVVLRRNREGRHAVRSDAQMTLFYMPHCGRLLYNNVMFANWGSHLRRIMILGNSIVESKSVSSVASHGNVQASHTIDALIKDKYIHQQFIAEEGFDAIGIFNDLFLTTLEFPQDYWTLDRCMTQPQDASVAQSSEIISTSLSSS